MFSYNIFSALTEGFFMSHSLFSKPAAFPARCTFARSSAISGQYALASSSDNALSHMPFYQATRLHIRRSLEQRFLSASSDNALSAAFLSTPFCSAPSVNARLLPRFFKRPAVGFFNRASKCADLLSLFERPAVDRTIYAPTSLVQTAIHSDGYLSRASKCAFNQHFRT